MGICANIYLSGFFKRSLEKHALFMYIYNNLNLKCAKNIRYYYLMLSRNERKMIKYETVLSKNYAVPSRVKITSSHIIISNTIL